MTTRTTTRPTIILESTGEVLEREAAWPCPTKTSRSFIHCPYCGGCQGETPKCLYCGGEFLPSWLSLDQPAISYRTDPVEAA